MQTTVSVPILQKCVDLLGELEGSIFHKLLKKLILDQLQHF